ncbi:MFS transporter [Rossellomorea aquimaris]|uniref:MFS transporter n=1 Tax=Rossellomorea aquimaris TaxID=189382 RepID=UPI001CD28AD6|nr:MFS transporter [Rossellomorea aquimaris]MCA1056543.1 MFS transporter [Rossellomorea aquimaris]
MASQSFRHLWVGQALANMGDIFYVVALISLIDHVTGSPLYLTIVPLVITSSRFLSSVMVPLLLNRTQLKWLIAYSQLVKTMLLVLMFSLVVLSLGNGWIYLGVAGLISFMDGWALPARNAYVPFIVKREELLGANGFLSTVDQTIQFSSWAVGGLLVAALNESILLALVILLFLISTYYMLRLPVIPRTTLQQKRHWWEQFGEGWSEVGKNKSLRNLFVIYAIESAAGAVWIAAVLYLYVDLILNRSEAWWGFINSSFFIGLVLASYLIYRMHGYFSSKRSGWLPVCMLMTSIATFIFAWNSSALFALILSLVFGFFDQIKTIILQTFLQETVTAGEIGKVYAAQGALTTLIFGLSSVGVGLLMEVTSVETVFTLSASLLGLTLFPVYKIRKVLS